MTRCLRGAFLLTSLSACAVYGPELLDEARGGGGAAAEPTGGSAGGAGRGSGGNGGGAGPASGGAPSSGTAGSDSGGTISTEAGAGGSAEGGSTSLCDGGCGGETVIASGGEAAGGEAGAGESGGASGAGGASGVAGASAGAGGAECPAGDCCPEDENKTDPGSCGCGAPETDGDDDGSPDCVDDCAADPDKTEPGVCGCGVPDEDDGSVAGCVGLLEALAHRYAFEGTGSTATDSQGGEDGAIVNAALSGDGSVALAGTTSDQYVNLPNGLISALTDATIEVWLTWGGGSAWQRIFDFGTSGTEDAQGTGTTYLFLSPSAGSGVVHGAFTTAGLSSETPIDATASLPANEVSHVALVIDDTGDRLLLYVNGVPAASVAFTGHLVDLDDSNMWLGRSQYSMSPELGATLHEVRIYDAALRAAEVATSHTAGVNPPFLDP